MDNVLFICSALLAIFGAISVVSLQNIMHACLGLLSSFLGVAGLYLTLGAEFVAVTQIVVYVGGVVILMVFAVMLTGGANQGSNKFGIIKIPSMGNFKTYLVAFFSALVLFMSVGKLLKNIISTTETVNLPGFTETIEKIGILLVSDHVLAFEISSVLLLGALVGAAIIARPKSRQHQNIGNE